MYRVIVFIFFILFACKGGRIIGENSEPKKIEFDTTPSPEILMVLFYINQKDSVSITQSYTNHGVYRGKGDSVAIAHEGDLKISFLDQTGTVCEVKIVPNPLVKKAEVASADGSGRIVAQAVAMVETSFFIRMQWNDCFQKCSVEKYEEGKWMGLKTLPFTKPEIR